MEILLILILIPPVSTPAAAADAADATTLQQLTSPARPPQLKHPGLLLAGTVVKEVIEVLGFGGRTDNRLNTLAEFSLDLQIQVERDVALRETRRRCSAYRKPDNSMVYLPEQSIFPATHLWV
jgi:hypothetical protein